MPANGSLETLDLSLSQTSFYILQHIQDLRRFQFNFCSVRARDSTQLSPHAVALSPEGVIEQGKRLQLSQLLAGQNLLRTTDVFDGLDQPRSSSFNAPVPIFSFFLNVLCLSVCVFYGFKTLCHCQLGNNDKDSFALVLGSRGSSLVSTQSAMKQLSNANCYALKIFFINHTWRFAISLFVVNFSSTFAKILQLWVLSVEYAHFITCTVQYF